MLILTFLDMYASLRKLSMVWNRLLVPGSSASVSFYLGLGSLAAMLKPPFLFFIANNISFIFSSTWTILYIILGSDHTLLTAFVHQLHIEFATMDLASISYFPGLDVTSASNNLFLSQTKYARDILARAQLLDCKWVPLFSDITLYRSLVGALQYLIITRPDLSHSINFVSQFLHALTEMH